MLPHHVLLAWMHGCQADYSLTGSQVPIVSKAIGLSFYSSTGADLIKKLSPPEANAGVA